MKLTMKLAILSILLIFVWGCTTNQNTGNEQDNPGQTVSAVSSTQDLTLNDNELQMLGMTSNGCNTDEYQSGPDSPVTYTTFCNYTITKDNTEVLLIMTEFSNIQDLNGSYQYDSSHLFGADGLISENTYGDQSRFRINSEGDYGSQYNDPNITYYHLWITKDLYLIHITSKGSNEFKDDTKVKIEEMAQDILSRFD